MTGPPRDAAQVAESAVFASVHEGPFPLEWQDDPWAGVDAAGEWLLSLAADVRPDVVHLNGYAHAALPVAGAGRRGRPLRRRVVVARGARQAPPPAWDEYRRRVAAGLVAADRVVAPTAAVAADLAAAYGFSRAQVVPNGRAAGRGGAGVEGPAGARGRTAVGRRQGRRRARAGSRRSCPVRSRVAGDGRGARGGRSHSAGWPGRTSPGSWRPRPSTPPRPATSRSGWACWRPGSPAARSCSGTCPACARCGGARRPTSADDQALAAALTALLEDGDLARARGAAARDRALRFSPARTAAGYRAQYAALPVGAR